MAPFVRQTCCAGRKPGVHTMSLASPRRTTCGRSCVKGSSDAFGITFKSPSQCEDDWIGRREACAKRFQEPDSYEEARGTRRTPVIFRFESSIIARTRWSVFILSARLMMSERVICHLSAPSAKSFDSGSNVIDSGQMARMPHYLRFMAGGIEGSACLFSWTRLHKANPEVQFPVTTVRTNS